MIRLDDDAEALYLAQVLHNRRYELGLRCYFQVKAQQVQRWLKD